jgi:hypothetical protein
MTPVEKWNAFSDKIELPMALLPIAMGVAFLFFRRKFAAYQLEGVRRGELSEVQARRNSRFIHWGGFFLIGCGVAQLALAFFGL